MIWWSFFIPWISSTGKKCVRVLVHTTWVIATPTHCKALNCVDTWPQQTCDQPAESLDQHSVCWWKYRCTVVDRTDTTLSESFYFAVPTFEIFSQLAFFPGVSLITNARLLHKHRLFWNPKLWVFSAAWRVENRRDGGGFSGLNEALWLSTAFA